MAINTYIITGVAALVVASFTPFMLPSSLHVERSAVIKSKPDQLFKMIASNRGYQKFNPYKSVDPGLKIDFQGPESGVGSGFAFNGKDGKGIQVISALTENSNITMAIDLGMKGQPIQTFDLTPTDGGTKVTWGMDMEFGWNPIARVMGLFLEDMVAPVFERGLKNMATVVAKSA